MIGDREVTRYRDRLAAVRADYARGLIDQERFREVSREAARDFNEAARDS